MCYSSKLYVRWRVPVYSDALVQGNGQVPSLKNQKQWDKAACVDFLLPGVEEKCPVGEGLGGFGQIGVWSWTESNLWYVSQRPPPLWPFSWICHPRLCHSDLRVWTHQARCFHQRRCLRRRWSNRQVANLCVMTKPCVTMHNPARQRNNANNCVGESNAAGAKRAYIILGQFEPVYSSFFHGNGQSFEFLPKCFVQQTENVLELCSNILRCQNELNPIILIGLYLFEFGDASKAAQFEDENVSHVQRMRLEHRVQILHILVQ